MNPQGYGEIRDFIYNLAIRPPRAGYDLDDLGNKEIKGKDGKIISIRDDIQVSTSRDKELEMECSFFPIQNGKKNPCIIFVHGNAQNRLSNIFKALSFLEMGIQFCCYDFVGCGISEGETISFGYHESRDLEDLMNYLNSRYQISQFFIHGLSMGAATTLMCCSFTKNNISGIIIDSSYSDIMKLILEKTELPEKIVESNIEIINKEIMSKYNFPIKELKPIKCVANIIFPALFIHGKSDKLIRFNHSEELLKAYKGHKKLISFPGGHNDPRGEKVNAKILKFVKHLAIT